MQTTPFRQLPTPYLPTSTINPCWTLGIVEATPYQHTDSKEVLGSYNTAMAEIASKISSERKPPTSQLESWDESNATQRQHYIQKATEDCMLVCEVIAPNDGKQLFQEMTCATPENLNIEAKVDYVTKSLINAYRNANNRNTKTQILSLYAHKYSVSTLKKLHSQYGKLSTRQIRHARCHARIQGPGSILEKCEPLSRSTLFRILEVREASQRKSLQGLDNTAADGSAGFQMVKMIAQAAQAHSESYRWYNIS